MSHKKTLSLLLLYITLSVLILTNYNLTIESIEKSVDRCINSLLPAIFPFLILSKQISQLFEIRHSRITKKASVCICNNSEILEVALISLIVGYPLPAVLLNEKLKSGNISKHDAQKAICIINGASPSFYIFFIGKVAFSSLMYGFLLYLSQSITMLIFIKLRKFSDIGNTEPSFHNTDLASTLRSASETFITICSTVIFFGLVSDTVLSVLNHLRLKTVLSCILCSFFEVTNGIYLLSGLDGAIYIFFICLLCSSGGMSAYYQIKSVSKKIVVSFGRYFTEKLIMSVVMYFIFNIFYILTKKLFTC